MGALGFADQLGAFFAQGHRDHDQPMTCAGHADVELAESAVGRFALGFGDRRFEDVVMFRDVFADIAEQPCRREIQLGLVRGHGQEIASTKVGDGAAGIVQAGQVDDVIFKPFGAVDGEDLDRACVGAVAELVLAQVVGELGKVASPRSVIPDGYRAELA